MERKTLKSRLSFLLCSILHVGLFGGTSGCSLEVRLAEGTKSAAQLVSEIDSVADSWDVAGGATTIDIEATLHETGTIYYVVYDSDPGPMTALDIKTAALGGTGGTLIKVGTVAITSANQTITSAISGLPDDSTYYVKIAAEGDIVGLYPDSSIRSFTQVNPDQLTRTDFTSTSFSPGLEIRYMTYFPEDYYKESTDNYPLLIVLHGNGENAATAGVDTDANFESIVRNNAGLMRYIEDGTLSDLPLMVIQTRCPAYAHPGPWDCWNWFDEIGLIDEVLEHAKANLRVDEDRVYISGLSTGGAGSINYVKAYPEKIAAVVPISTAASVVISSPDCTALSDIPFWFFHNDGDTTQSPMTSEIAKIDLEACSPSAERKFSRYDSSGHNAWTKTYTLQGDIVIGGYDAYQAPSADLYSWLLSYSK